MDTHKNAFRRSNRPRRSVATNASEDRAAQLPDWLHRYNCHRPHASIGAKPPISRLGLTQDNVLSRHS